MTSDPEQEKLRLPAVLDLGAAEALLADVRERIGRDGRLRITAADVETLTLPCAQVLVAALRTSEGVSIETPSDSFTKAFKDLGLEEWLGRCSGQEQDAAPTAVEEAPDADLNPQQADDPAMPKRILTIDDSKTMRDMLMLTLAEAGFEVLQGVDGVDGLNVLGDDRVDVVITDINMPKMDGYEVIRQLRRSPIHRSTPILVLTTESEATKRELAREAGATGWMVKPFDPDQLVATVRRVAP